MEENDLIVKEVLKVIKDLRPNWNVAQASSYSYGHGYAHGRGFVSESILAFSEHGSFWVCLICDTEDYAYKEISPGWVDYYSNLVLTAPEIWVEFDRCHRIVKWAVMQDKVCPLDK